MRSEGGKPLGGLCRSVSDPEGSIATVGKREASGSDPGRFRASGRSEATLWSAIARRGVGAWVRPEQ